MFIESRLHDIPSGIASQQKFCPPEKRAGGKTSLKPSIRAEWILAEKNFCRNNYNSLWRLCELESFFFLSSCLPTFGRFANKSLSRHRPPTRVAANRQKLEHN
jgi:hypothetical protein